MKGNQHSSLVLHSMETAKAESFELLCCWPGASSALGKVQDTVIKVQDKIRDSERNSVISQHPSWVGSRCLLEKAVHFALCLDHDSLQGEGYRDWCIPGDQPPGEQEERGNYPNLNFLDGGGWAKAYMSQTQCENHCDVSLILTQVAQKAASG